jgi:GntR family transcriptional regulator
MNPQSPGPAREQTRDEQVPRPRTRSAPVLNTGDQLPAVREVVAAVAVNPDTVLNACRDMERRGLGRGARQARHVRPGAPARAAAWHPFPAPPQPGPLGPRGRLDDESVESLLPAADAADSKLEEIA